jgi:hypothetical protein
VSPGAEERPLLKDVTKQSSEDRDRTLLYVLFVMCSHELFKSPVNPITNSNPVHSHITRDYMNAKLAKGPFGNVTELRYWRTAVRNQHYVHEEVKNTLDSGNLYFH